jgi:T5SS/PEP-CTERM-associated repeat protein
MTTYTWNVIGAGDWDDQDNWWNDTAEMPDDGYPGAGDTAFIDTTEVTVSDDTVAILNANSTDIDGDITVTNYIGGGTFTDGTVTAGTAQVIQINFEGVSLTANTIEESDLDAGKVTANVLVDPVVKGATVTAKSIARVPSSQYASNSDVTVESGSLTADTMTLVGATPAIDSPDFFTISGGTATITGAATATGAGVVIYSRGGTLRFNDGLTLSDGAALDVIYGGKTTAETLTAGENGDGTIEVEGAGSSLTVAKALTLGSGGVGNLTVTDGGALSVGGNLVVGSGSLTVDDDSTFDLKGELIIGDDATDSSADATSSPAAHKIKGTVTLDSPVKLDADCIIGDDTTGTLIVKSTVNANHYLITIGNQETGNGQLTVDGKGAKLDNIGSLDVGVDGAGTVLVENGGYVLASDLADGSSTSSSSLGTITVSGGNLRATQAYVGEHGSGSLTVQSGGAVIIGLHLHVGTDGHVTVSSNSSIDVDSTLSRNGSVVIGSGGIVSLNCFSGAYKANTVINGGSLVLMRTGAISEAYSLGFAGAGRLTLNSGVALSTALNGFGTGDSITLRGVTADNDVYSKRTFGGTLTLENGNGASVATLNFLGSYTFANFHLSEVGGNAVVTFNPSKGSAASIQDQIFNSALLSGSSAYHGLDAVGGRGSAGASATPDYWSVGHSPGPSG